MSIPEKPYTREEMYLDGIATGDVSGIPEKPYTREEMYWNAIAQGDDSLAPDKPFTRKEMYLAAIASGDASKAPDTPFTREEMYLDAIASGDSSKAPEIPYTRYEMYLAEIVAGGGGGGGGESYTVTGISPLLLERALAKPISSLIQTGKCEQASTPTPSAPVDIVCNNGAIKYGVLGKNLFDKNSEQSGNYYVNSNGNVAQAASNASVYFRCQPNTTYYFKHTSVVGGCRAFTVSVEDWAIGTPANEMVGAVTSEPNVVRSITTEADAKWVFFLYGRSTGTTATYDEQAADFMVSTEPLTADTPYEPYKGMGIYTVGTPEVISVGGKNLFDDATNIIEQGAISSSDGGNPSGTSTYRVRTAGYVPVKPNTQYTLSVVIDGYASGTARGVFLIEYETAAVAGYTGNNSGWNAPNGYTFTTGATTNYIRIVFAAGSNSSAPVAPSDISNVQLELGNTATAYEPYKGEPQTASAENLFAVGDYADTQEIISGAVNRKIGIYVFDGTETWIDGNYGYITEAVQDQSGETYTPLSTHFKGTTGTPQSNTNTFRCYRTSGGVGRIYIAPNRTTYDTKEAFAAFIAAQYAAGTPVIVLYPLAESTTESVAAQPLHTVNGDNTVAWTAEVSGTTKEITYKKEASS